MRSGSISISTGMRKRFVSASNSSCTSRHLPDLDAAELDRRADLEAAHRLVEVEQLVVLLRVDRALASPSRLS